MLLDANIPAFRGFGIQQRVAIFALELVKRRRLEALAITRTHKGCAFIGRPCKVRPEGGFPAKAVMIVMPQDRQSVVEGKSVSVRVDLGGGRVFNKNKISMKNNG